MDSELVEIQKRVGVTADGVWGPKTRHAIALSLGITAAKPAAGGVDAGVVAHKGAVVVAEPLSYFVDAVPGVEHARREQMPDLVGSDRADPGGGGELVEPAGDVVRSQRLAGAAGEHVPRRRRCLRSSRVGQAVEGHRVKEQGAGAVVRLGVDRHSYRR